ncbi:MAG: Dam family site-specific DNA-(adenine-N6)-methyltransferase [Gammaproteobacteria bacterium]
MISSRPFLKWPGGKFRLVERINNELGKGKRLIEPFVGSAAVFMNSNFDQYLLADNNPDLINLYKILNKEGENFIDSVRPLFKPETNNAETYYEIREDFNNSEDVRHKAALFIYLNRHCYNGLCRYNKSGGFNSPFGRYKKPNFPEEAMRAFDQKSEHATFQISSFKETMQQAEKGDVIYCDPPYVPLSRTANFTNYSAEGFGIDKQQELADMANQLSANGIKVVISNHDTKEIRQLYKGAKIIPFDVPRFISQDANNRNKAQEVLAVFKARKT